MPTISQQVLQSEAAALIAAADRLGDSMDRAADIILNSQGKVILAGLGKSGHIAQKIAATLRSVGCCAVFLHATEAVHGDLMFVELALAHDDLHTGLSSCRNSSYVWI